MKKAVYGYKLGRNTKQRKSLFKGLMNSLILNEKIDTTLAKARAIRGPLEKIITVSKTDSIQARRYVMAELGLAYTTAKLIELIGPKFKERPGGYLRIIKLGSRAGDNAPLVRLEFVEEIKPIPLETVKTVETQDS